MPDDLRSVNAEDSLFSDIDVSNDFMISYVFRDPKLCIELLGYHPFGQGLYRYASENRCAEDGQLLLRDETCKLFL